MRNRCTVNRVLVTPFLVSGSSPYMFQRPASMLVWLTRETVDGSRERALLRFHILEGCRTDGASTRWPVTLLVPHWRQGEDEYNAGPVAHDLLYIVEGHVEGLELDLSREEVDDILRGIWRCWGMSRLLAGIADKGIEIFAGGKGHWGCDTYGIRDRFSVEWESQEKEK